MYRCRNTSKVVCRHITSSATAASSSPFLRFAPALRPTARNSVLSRQFSRFNRKGKGGGGSKSTTSAVTATPPPPVKEEWSAVTDEASGQIYYWNEKTNETTHLGAPNPNHNTLAPPPQEQQGGGMMSGLGGMVVQGMAMGTGSAIAHGVIGSMMGGGGGGDDGHDDGGGDDGFDI
jgi:hypothetical protein